MCVCTVHAWLSTLWAICAVDSNPSALSISLFFSLSLALPLSSLSGGIDTHLAASEAPFLTRVVDVLLICFLPCACWDVQMFSRFLRCWLLLLLEALCWGSPAFLLNKVGELEDFGCFGRFFFFFFCLVYFVSMCSRCLLLLPPG